jgi:Holliday junction resolvase RusA-like endonuclease
MTRPHPINRLSRCLAKEMPGRVGARIRQKDLNVLIVATAEGSCNNEPISVIIAGEPFAKARARITRRGFAYTPAHTRKYEAHGRLAAQLAMGNRPPLDVPVRLDLVAELPIPASWSKKKQALAIAGDVLPTSRPDLDNYVKAGLDSLNEIVVRDDSQVIEVAARKRYSIAPKLVMTVYPLLTDEKAKQNQHPRDNHANIENIEENEGRRWRMRSA